MGRAAISLRIALLAVLLALASNLAIVGFVYWRTYDQGAATLRARVVEEAAALASVHRSAGPEALRGVIAETLRAGDGQIAIGVFGRDGHPIAGNIAVVEPGGMERSGYREGAMRLGRMPVLVPVGYVARPVAEGWLLSGRALGETLALRRTLERSLLLAVALSLLLGPIYGVVIARYVGTRVDAIRRVVDAAGGGDLDRRVPLTRGGRGDAFDLLGARINAMLGRVGALMAELRILTDSLAHDLRSPVGRLRARIERAMTVSDEGQREQLLAGVITEADALMRILSTAIEIGKTEAGAGREQFATIEPGGLVTELAEMYEPLVEEAGLALAVEIEAPLRPLLGHPQLLAQALSNLIDNAVRHGAGGGALALFAAERDGMLCLGVADRGRGIGAHEKAEALRRFGRLDVARSVAGAGLGLSLVQAVAHLHGGSLMLGDNAPGLRATIMLPSRPTGSMLDSEGIAH